MEDVGYARALRQRWVLIGLVAAVCVGSALVAPPSVGTFPEPSERIEDYTAASHARYANVAVIGTPPTSSTTLTPGIVQTDAPFATLVFYLGDRDVMENFTRRINYDGDDPTLPSQVVKVEPDPQTGTVVLTGFGGTALQATKNTKAFIAAINEFFRDMRLTSGADTLNEARARVRALDARLDRLSVRIRQVRERAGGDVSRNEVLGQQTALQARYRSTLETYTGAYDDMVTVENGSNLAVSNFLVLHPPRAGEATLVSPSLAYSVPIRLLLGLLVGLLLGAAVALLLGHYSRRIVTRRGLEAAVGAPVIAEIPRAPWWWRFLPGRWGKRAAETVTGSYQALAVLLIDRLTLTATVDGAQKQLERTSNMIVGGGEVPSPVRAIGPSSRARAVLVLTHASYEPDYVDFLARTAEALAEMVGPVTVLRRNAVPHGRRDLGIDDQVRPTVSPTSIPLVSVGDLDAALAVQFSGLSPVVIIDAGRASSPDLAGTARAADAVITVCQYRRTRFGDAERASALVRLAGATPDGAVLIGVPGGVLPRRTGAAPAVDPFKPQPEPKEHRP